jgi:UDP-glucose 4-epimerase
VDGTKHVLRAMYESGCTKLVFASSAAVYDVCSTSIVENHTLRPSSYYGETKKEAEGIIQNEKKIHSVILRYFNVVGKESIERNPKLIPSALRVIKGLQKKLHVYGHNYPTPDKTAIRDYVHVDDVVTANCASIEYLKHADDSIICNIGSGIGISNLDVIHEVERIYDAHIPVVYEKKRKESAVSIANIAKAKALLHWYPQSSTMSSIINSFI